MSIQPDNPTQNPAQFDDPLKLAEHFKQHHYRDDQKKLDTLHFFQGDFWAYKQTHYEKLPDTALDAQVWQELKRQFGTRLKPPKITRAKVADVVAALKAITLVKGAEFPVWLGEGPARRLLAMQNGLIDLDALFRGEAATPEPHSPEWFSPVVLPYAYDPEAQAPQWLAFLDRMFEGDAERIRLLHEWLGYLISGDTQRQKFLVLVGPPASGKSTILKVASDLLGLENVSHLPLDWAFEHPSNLITTLGKLANITPEAEKFSREAEGLLKAFTAGERITFPRKYKDAVDAFPTARVVCATNSVPQFHDRSGAIHRRMTLLPFNLSIPEGERDLGFAEKLKAELSSIFNRALAAFRAIEVPLQKDFSKCAASTAEMHAHVRESHPERAFLEDNYRFDPLAEMRKDEVFAAYKDFCREGGYKPIEDALFAKQVKRVFPGVKSKRHRIPVEGQVPFWIGLVPNADPSTDDDEN